MLSALTMCRGEGWSMLGAMSGAAEGVDLGSTEMPRTDVVVVLAHGGWADGSSWNKVIAGLRSEGVKAIAAPLPMTTLADDVAALDHVLERVEGPVVVAAHAYAGAVIATPLEQALLAATQRPLAAACIGVPVRRPLWKDRPSWFLVAEEDRMIPTETQRHMAERMKARVRTAPADHVPMITKASAVVGIVLEAVREVEPGR
jgi:pimeloyl-ACP methyl ester carboxylesterase